MSLDYKRQILSILVDWYEDSAAYVRKQAPSRRRIMKLYEDRQTDFPAYDIDNHTVRKDINQAVLELAGLGFVRYEWMRGQWEHILSRLWFNFDKLEEAYVYLHRQPKGDAVDDVLAQLEEIRVRTHEDWALRWLNDTMTVLCQKRSVGSVLPEDASARADLLKAIAFLTNRADIETLERVFSVQCFGDSKHFERSVKARLIRILKKYLIQDDCTDEDALRAVGLVRYTEMFSFSGALSITLPRGTVDFSALPFGGTLTASDIRQGRIALGSDILRILSIENRANYIEYVHKHQGKDEFVLFHGGQFSPAKGVFLRALVSSMPKGCVFYHWGDIDYGGFRILGRLRREIWPDAKAWRMDLEMLRQYAEYTRSFPESYAKKLAALLTLPELCDCIPCIEFMLASRVRLEQEALLT